MDESLMDKLSRCARAKPFVSYEVRLTTGQCHRVKDPFHLAMTDDKIAIVDMKMGVQLYRPNQLLSVELLTTDD